MSRYTKGRSGNPKGRPKGIEDCRTRYRKLVEPQVPALLEKAVSLALAGDMAAMRLVLERILPAIKARDEPVTIDGLAQGSLISKAETVVHAMGDGKISPSEGSTILGGIAALCKIKESEELESRIAALESSQARSKGTA